MIRPLFDRGLSHSVANLFAIWLTIFGALVGPCIGHAEDGVSLLIWLEDSGKGMPKALTREKFNAALKMWDEMGVGPIREVFIEHGQGDKIPQRVQEAILPTDRITNLIISTHGATKQRKNKVYLEDLGEFDSQGSSGRLHDLLLQLAPHFGSELNISLQACSTACGNKEQIKSRASGLQKELSAFGVRRLSIWGARTPLAFDDKYDAVTNEQSIGQIKQLLRGLKRNSILTGIGIGSVAFTMISNFGFDYESFKTAAMIGAVDAAITFFGVYALLYRNLARTDTKGYLSVSEGGQTQILEVESGTINAVHSTRDRCKTLLAPSTQE